MVNLSCNDVSSANANHQAVKSVSVLDDGIIVVDLTGDDNEDRTHPNRIYQSPQQQQFEYQPMIIAPLSIKEEETEILDIGSERKSDVSLVKHDKRTSTVLYWSERELAYLIHGVTLFGHKSLENFNEIKKKFYYIFNKKRTPANLQRRFNDLKRKYRISIEELHRKYAKYLDLDDE